MEKTPFHPFRSADAKERFLNEYDARAARWPVPSETKTVRDLVRPHLCAHQRQYVLALPSCSCTGAAAIRSSGYPT